MPISPYLARIRESVGHELVFVPAVSALIRDADGRVLLVYETDAEAWSTPGGSVDVDERPADAAQREVLEETGLIVRLHGIVTVLGGPEFRHVYKNRDETAYVSTVFRATVVGGEYRPDDDEVSAVDWFAVDALASVPLSNFAATMFRHLGWL